MGRKRKKRLSSLPDALLIEIISLLPTPSAIATSAISRRWRYLWTHLTTLNLQFDPNSTAPGLDIFTAVDHIIGNLFSTNMHSFNLSIRYAPHSYDFEARGRYWENCSSHLKSWIPQLYARHLSQLVLDFANPPHLVELPSSIFESQSLELLHLPNHEVAFELPATGIISLPNLKSLRFKVFRASQRELMYKLLESCPLLEILSLQLWTSFKEDGDVIQVSCSNLKRLFLVVSGDFKLNVQIAAPKLEYLDANLGYSTFCFMNTPTSLTEAKVRRTWSNIANQVFVVVRGISGVRVLDLLSDVIDSISCVENAAWMPIFHNLTRLTVHVYYDSWDALMFLLQFVPCLEVLVIETNFPNTWVSSDVVPPCLSNKVKIIEIKGFEVTQDVLVLLKYMLANACVLKSLIVGVSYLDQIETVQLHKELELCEKMYAFPRSSLDCDIRFSGKFVSISSKGIKIEGCPSAVVLSRELLLAYGH